MIQKTHTTLLTRKENEMAVERVDYYSDEEYEHALAQEAAELAYNHYPPIVPCFKCGGQMYEENDDPEKNICGSCTS